MGGDRHGRLPGQPASLLSTRRSEARNRGDNPVETAAATQSRSRTGVANRLASPLRETAITTRSNRPSSAQDSRSSAQDSRSSQIGLAVKSDRIHGQVRLDFARSSIRKSGLH